jgi:hypothetical protein
MHTHQHELPALIVGYCCVCVYVQVTLAQDIHPVTALPASLSDHALVFTAGDAGVAPVEPAPGSPGGDLGGGLSGAKSVTDLDTLLGPDSSDALGLGCSDAARGLHGGAASDLALGNTVHGIALKLRVEDLPKVDAFAASRAGVGISLVRASVRVELYDGAIFGTEVDCWAHVVAAPAPPEVASPEVITAQGAEPASGTYRPVLRPAAVDTRPPLARAVPDARMVETVVQGCVRVGVKSAYVEGVLRKVPSRPRAVDAGTLSTLPLSGPLSGRRASTDGPAPLPVWGAAEVRLAAANEPTGFVTCLNGKVLVCAPRGSLSDGAVATLRAALGGRDAEAWACREW